MDAPKNSNLLLKALIVIAFLTLTAVYLYYSNYRVGEDALYADIELATETFSDPETGSAVLVKISPDGDRFTGTVEFRYVKNDNVFSKFTYENGLLTEGIAYMPNGDLMGRQVNVYKGNSMVINRVYNEDDNLMEELVFPEGSDDGSGHVKMWYKNGQLKYEATFTGTFVYQGLMTRYDQDGTILEQERFNNGLMVEKIR